MAVSLKDIVQGGSDRYGHSPIAHDAIRSGEFGVYLPVDLALNLFEIVQSGVTQLELSEIGGTLHITNNVQLIPNPEESSVDFCVVHLRYAAGRFVTFEINLGSSVITVARKSNIDPRMPKKVGFSNCIGHEDMLPTLAGIVREAKLQTMAHVDITSTADQVVAVLCDAS